MLKFFLIVYTTTTQNAGTTYLAPALYKTKPTDLFKKKKNHFQNWFYYDKHLEHFKTFKLGIT